MKRTRDLYLSSLVLLCLALLLIPSLHGRAEEPIYGTTQDGFHYKINGQEASITGYEG